MYEWRYLKHASLGWQIVFVYMAEGEPFSFCTVYSEKMWTVSDYSDIEWGPTIPSPEILQAYRNN